MTLFGLLLIALLVVAVLYIFTNRPAALNWFTGSTIVLAILLNVLYWTGSRGLAG